VSRHDVVRIGDPKGGNLVAGQPARRPPRPSHPADYGTGPVVLLIEIAVLSELSMLRWPLFLWIPLVGPFVVYNYLLFGILVVALTALGMWLKRRMRVRPERRGRSKVIPFPEHRRRRGA
jgi:hypothetical protein